MTWPRSNIEQELFVQSLERQVARLTHTRQSLVIHSYSEPTRSAWENKYISSLGGDPPIPPGLRLCWYDMRNGFVRQYQTTFDTQNGTRSSGEVYPAIRNQMSSPIRLIGRVQIGAGTVGGADSTALTLGANIVTQQRRGLLALDLFFRIGYSYVDDGTALWLDFGGDKVNPEDVTVSVNNVATGGAGELADTPNSAYAFDNTFAREVRLTLLPEGPDGNDGATAFPDLLCHARIFNPFMQNPANVVVVGTIYHFNNTFLSGAPADQLGGIRHFYLHRLTPIKLQERWRINFREETSENLVPDVYGDGWVYGYYNEAQSESQEFTDVI